MIIKVIVEIVLLWVLVAGSPMFWQLCKRRRFVKAVLREQSYLDEFIPHMLPKHTLSVPQYGQRNEIGWFVTIATIIQVDRSAINSALLRIGTVLLIALGISFFLGYLFFIANKHPCFFRFRFTETAFSS
jgi:hypothetical protein